MVNGPPTELTLERVAAAFSGRYRIEGELGVGGMATVFVANDVKMGRRVAIKVLRPDLGASVGVERFMRETEIAAGLNHPHIVPVLDRGEAGGFLYYVMSLIEGETLRDLLSGSSTLGVEEVVRFLRDVVDALEYAHRLDLVHRDIKPENVLVSGRHALVTDFGVAKALSLPASSQQLTTMGVAVGSPRYMSPEQAVGDELLDQRSDVYAVGLLAYELLTGDPPFTGSPRKVLTAQITQTPTPVTEVRPDVPAELAKIIMRCLAKEPEERYQTSQQLLEEVEALSTTGSRAVRGRSIRSSRVLRWASAVAVVAIAAAGAATLGNRDAGSAVAEHTDRIIVLPFENRTGDASLGEAGLMAAEFVTRGLHREEIGSAVPAASVTRMLGALGNDIADPVAALVEGADAQILVSGSIRQEGGVVIINSDIVDVRTGDVIGVTEQARASGVSEAIAIATQRIQGLLATHFNFGQSFFTMSPPPSIEVYHELRAAREAFYRGAFAEATARFDRVTELAPDYLSHIAGAAAVRFWTGDYAAADSALTSALATPGRLTSSERLGLQYMLATVRGDLEEEYRTATAQGGSDPLRVYGHALAALRTNRAREALAVFETVDFDSPLAQLNAPLWGIPPLAYHMLGNYSENLAAAERARALYPTDLGVLNLMIAPAAALGHTELLDKLLSEASSMTGSFEVPPTDTPGWSIILAGLELSAHGQEAEAGDMLARAVSWYREETAQRSDDEALQFASAIALYYSGDFGAALPAFRALSDAAPDNIDYMGFLGVTLAREGETAEASLIDTRLATLQGAYRFGQHTRWRARIAAFTGDLELSMALLREAFSDGISLHFGQDWGWLHIDPDLEPLRGLPEFAAFIAPRDGG